MRGPLAYRPEVDGLRAIAVLAVLVYHLGKAAKGGFVGVDVFFVISGYLITSIILADMDGGTFSLVKFYERRVRRILPALFACLAFTLVGGYFVLFPDEFIKLADGVIAATFFVANYYYASISGYFQPTASTLPLIHTWSLAVEEQFYLLFPLALMLLGRWRRRTAVIVLAATAIVSFCWSEVMVRQLNDGAYYYLAPRGWELLIGSLLALGAVPAVTSARLREAGSIVGLLAIVIPVFAFNKNTPFPGFWALLPCLGAAAIIHLARGQDTLVGRLLSTRVLVGIGLISYSLYLWHLPIIAFYKLRFETSLSHPIQAMLGAISLGAAYLSWRFIEQPFRKRKVAAQRTRLFAYGATAAAGVALLATVVVQRDGLKDRFSPEVRQLAAFTYDAVGPMRNGECFVSRAAARRTDFKSAMCLAMKPGKSNVLILGDSYAAHLWSGLDRTFPDVNFMQATASGCGPDLVRDGSDRCREVMRVVFDDFLPGKRLDAIIIAMDWSGEEPVPLMRTVEMLRPHALTIVVFGPMVEYRSPLPRLLTRSVMEHDPTIIDRSRSRENFVMDASFRSFFGDKRVQYVSLIDALCKRGSCVTADEHGLPVQFDRGHLTASGSAILARGLAGQLNFGGCATAALQNDGPKELERGKPFGTTRPACAR